MGSILVIVIALAVLGAIAALAATIQSYLKARRIARGEASSLSLRSYPTERAAAATT